MSKKNRYQDNHVSSCRRSGRMALLTLCGRCNQSVVGVIIKARRGRYAVECKNCGYSATSHFDKDSCW